MSQPSSDIASRLIQGGIDAITSDISGWPSPPRPSKKEPTHIKFNNRSHYGVNKRYGEHVAINLHGYQIHLYPDHAFIITPHNKAFTTQLRPGEANLILGLMDTAKAKAPIKTAMLDELRKVVGVFNEAIRA